MEKHYLDRQTRDGAQLTIEQIAAICPSVITEVQDENTGEIVRKVNFTTLRQLLGDLSVETPHEAYDFTWVGKTAARREAAMPISQTLRPCPDESVDWDTTKNLYIEGDNLQVLKLLQNYYAGQIKMIYIDPPYNTGQDFVYHDDFHQTIDEYEEAAGVRDELGNRYFVNNDSNGRFHSDWCSMIYARLMIARSLLADDGIMFISIDDNEIDNLRKICDEIFGESNWINTICINMNSLSGVKMTHVIKGKRFPAQKEYLLVYKKGLVQPILSIEKKPKAAWDKEYNMIIPELKKEQFESFATMSDEQMNAILAKMHLISLAEYAKREDIQLSDEWKFENAYRIFGTKSNKSLAKKTMDLEFHQQIVGYTNTDGNKRLFRTDYNKDTKDPRIELVQAASTLEVFISDNWTDISNDGGVAQEGGVIYPNGKKPLQLLSRIVKTANSKDGIFLDFFAGSSTTAHAVLLQNLIDEGTRRFIMVQLPEDLDKTLERVSGDDKDDVLSLISFCDEIKKPHLITEIGKERIRRAGKQLKESSPLTTQDLDTGFRVLKLDETNFKQVSFAAKDYTQAELAGLIDNIKEDRSDLDLLFDCMLRWGVELSLPIVRSEADHCHILNVNDGDLVACLAPNEIITEAVIDAIAAMHPLRVVLRDTAFEEASQKMNIYELFKQRLGWSDDQASKQIRVI